MAPAVAMAWLNRTGLAHVGHPVIGVEQRCGSGMSATVVMNGMSGSLGVRPASASRNSGRIGSIIALWDATSMLTLRANVFCWVAAAMTASTGLGWPGDHGLARRGIHRHRYPGVIGDQRLGGGRIELQQGHRALVRRSSRHQPRPGGDHPQALAPAVRAPGHHRRGHLAHRMPDHRIRVRSRSERHNSVSANCNAHHHRLHPRDPAHRLSRRRARLQRESHLLNEDRLQLGDRGGERRFIGEQLPAHPRPLRALTRIHEHRARAARPLVRADHARRRVARPPAPAARPRPGRGRAAQTVANIACWLR